MKPKRMKNEAHVKKAIKLLLHEVGAWYFMPHMNGYGRAGIPDFIACLNGRLVAIETKFDGRSLTPSQQMELDAVAAADGVAIAVNQWGLDHLYVLLYMLKERDLPPGLRDLCLERPQP